jgi:hypothetical protein
MRNRNLLFAAFIMLMPCAKAFAQVPVDFVKNWVDWYNADKGLWSESKPEKICDDTTHTFHIVTYRTIVGFKGGMVPLTDMDTGELCACTTSQSNAVPANAARSVHASPLVFTSLKPRKEDNCDSDGTNGQPGSYSNNTTAATGHGEGVNQSIGVVSQPFLRIDESTVPQPFSAGASASARTPLPSRHLVRASVPQAAAGPAPFVYTLPYRTLVATPYLAQTPDVPTTCNAQINPTALQVAHIDSTVTRTNICTGQAIAVIPVPDLPLQVRVTPDGSQAIVTSYDSAISFISTSSNTVTDTLQLDPSFTPSGVAISPDGSYALVTNYEPVGDAYLAKLDLATKQITGRINLDTDYPQSVFINPDATLAWVTYPWNNIVEVIDLLTGAVVQRMNFDTPYGIAFNSTGSLAYLAGGEDTGSVAVINTENYALVATVPAGAGAGDVLVTPEDRFIYVNSAFGQSITLIDASSNTGSTFSLTGSPRGTVLVPTE